MDRAANLLAALYLIVIIGVYMENNNKLSVTPLTDDEVKKFNKEVDCILCSPVRNNIKDALDAILITVKSFYRRLPSEAASQLDGLIDTTTKAVSAAMRSVDEMDAVELEWIAERSNYAQIAFKLVESCIPSGVFGEDQLNHRDYVSRCARYLRKIDDILHIVGFNTMFYNGADITYVSASRLKSKLAECRGGKTLADLITIPGDPGYVIYGNILPARNTEQPAVISMLKQWADENVDDSCRDKFFAFVMRHEADVFNYAKVHRHDLEKSDEVYVFFYRWFLKEQEQASK